MTDKVSIGGELIPITSIAAIKPYDEYSIDPRNVNRQKDFSSSVRTISGHSVPAMRGLEKLAGELHFPLFHSSKPVALNPRFPHYTIEAYDPAVHGQPHPTFTPQTVIGWKTERARHHIGLTEPIETVIAQLPASRAQLERAQAFRPGIGSPRRVVPSVDS